MTQFLEQILPYSFSLLLISFFSSFSIYYIINRSSSKRFSFFHIPAAKSASNSKLLGGLGIAFGFLISTLYIYKTSQLTTHLNAQNIKLLSFSILPVIVLTISGFLDDRFELRARYKLLFQFVAISSFALISTSEISQNKPTLIFFISISLGILMVNGSNLLDGLDTMTIKLGIVTSLAFLYLGVKSESAAVVYVSSINSASLMAFYFFNREPAKIYLGEIGGSVIGFLFYLQATMSYGNLVKFTNGFNAMSWVIIACALPICELGISFLRRIAMGKSPFRGDKLHLHQIMKSKYNLSASKTSSIMAIFYATTFFTGYLTAKISNPIFGSFITVGMIVSFYLKVCMSEWRDAKTINNLNNLFLLFEDKTVHVIDSNLLTHVTVTVHERKKDHKKDQKKKAA